MHIAVLGGTFNPIHFGHLRVAEEAREALGLDKVLFMPAFFPPHKEDPALVDADTRLEMVRLAVEGNPGFAVSDMELKRGGRSFTIDTVRELKAGGKDGPRVSLIIGNDSFNDITTWCEYEELLNLASFIIVPRPGYPVKKPAEALPVELARKFWYDSTSGAYGVSYRNSEGNSLTYLDCTLLDISSSDIRRRIREGRSVRYLLPDGVIGFIREKGLYR
ncbi:MAG: nicotinate-nucleotide adenylyltransferase [Deltaproteobacteria bacterium]|nr:nicotinate-nucleotide adenylyltransferase [Deltaproteobacteria bacterium]